ncbi:uncharacterized protein F5147DRAFT_56210 [Suillus discolor]|uniref:Uncharacterized protein n=1 Tax=Suillus discolor TaxID=1912936 RepID=A0A9P7ES63_9AGAM|nr:uncharacterized protein F5147DRAFT_56210 [Suillus discolor]KAG2087917.1 hypothetical protein F5147DRAFT_56210 [Suillus discolor]
MSLQRLQFEQYIFYSIIMFKFTSDAHLSCELSNHEDCHFMDPNSLWTLSQQKKSDPWCSVYSNPDTSYTHIMTSFHSTSPLSVSRSAVSYNLQIVQSTPMAKWKHSLVCHYVQIGLQGLDILGDAYTPSTKSEFIAAVTNGFARLVTLATDWPPYCDTHCR